MYKKHRFKDNPSAIYNLDETGQNTDQSSYINSDGSHRMMDRKEPSNSGWMEPIQFENWLSIFSEHKHKYHRDVPVVLFLDGQYNHIT